MQTVPRRRKGSTSRRLESLRIVSANEPPSGEQVAKQFLLIFREEISGFLRKLKEKKSGVIAKTAKAKNGRRVRKSTKK